MNQLQQYSFLRKLKSFAGTTSPFYHERGATYRYTEGLRHALTALDAYWLLDDIIDLQQTEEVRGRQQQVWELDACYDEGRLNLVKPDGTRDFVRRIKFLDFPLERIEIWLSGTLFSLPNER